MELYKLLLTILTVAIGFIAIVVLVWKQKSSSSRIFQYLAAVILFFNLWLIISLIYQSILLYFRYNFITDSEVLISHSYYFVSRFIQLIMVYNVVLLTWEILKRDRLVLERKILNSAIILFCAVLSFGFLVFLITRHEKLFLITKEIAATVVQWGSLISLIIIIRSALEIKDKQKRISLIFISTSWGLFLVSIVFLTISGYLKINLWLIQLPIEITLDFIISSVILWWIWKFSHALTDERIAPIERDNQEKIEALVTKFEFTKRELEIIELICQGDSNQEIADRLFISLRTVKAHIYNIFTKTGVKSRIQLANLFTIQQ